MSFSTTSSPLLSNISTCFDQPDFEYLFIACRKRDTVVLFMMDSKIQDGTARSFLDAMINAGDNPNMKSINAVLDSFGNLDHVEQDKVMESPEVNLEHIIHLKSQEQALKVFSTGTLSQSGARKRIARKCLAGTLKDSGKIWRTSSME